MAAGGIDGREFDRFSGPDAQGRWVGVVPAVDLHGRVRALLDVGRRQRRPGRLSKQGDRLQRLAQIMAGGSKEPRFAEIGVLGLPPGSLQRVEAAHCLGAAEHQNAALAECERINEIIQGQQKILSGNFKFAAIPTVAPNILPGLLESYAKNFPAMKLQVTEMETDQRGNRFR